jgi:hypothetical protein
MYRQLHEETIASTTPFAQVAIEYEIEMLPVQLGPQLLRNCEDVLGAGILECLSFLREHITLDVAHTRFNERQLERLLQTNGGYLPVLVRAGRAALEAYALFLHDCVQLSMVRWTRSCSSSAITWKKVCGVILSSMRRMNPARVLPNRVFLTT